VLSLVLTELYTVSQSSGGVRGPSSVNGSTDFIQAEDTERLGWMCTVCQGKLTGEETRLVILDAI
jgi:hypothetical protein